MVKESATCDTRRILREIFDPANRANPYPLFAELRQTPVCWQEDGPRQGTYVVSTYREIAALLHDPRISSDLRNCTQTGRGPFDPDGPYIVHQPRPSGARSPARAGDAPLRAARTPRVRGTVAPGDPAHRHRRCSTSSQDERQFDVVEGFAYPLPVTVICGILGVPRKTSRSSGLGVDALIESLAAAGERARAGEQAQRALNEYMAGWWSAAASSRETTCSPAWRPTPAPRGVWRTPTRRDRRAAAGRRPRDHRESDRAMGC